MAGVVFPVAFVLIAVVGSVSGSTFSANIISDVNQTAISNTTVVLPCLASVSGPVRWCFHPTPTSDCDEIAFNGRIVNGHSKHYGLRENNLTVKSATTDYGGVYMCIEENGLGDRWHRIRLTVYDTDAKSVVVAQTGHASALHCGAGTPPFVWFYQSPLHIADQPVLVDGDINYKDRVFLAPSRPTALLINDVQDSDTGLYTCVANAGRGPTRFTIRLDVESDTLRATVACNTTSEASAVSQSSTSFTVLCLAVVMLFVISAILISVLAVLYCRAKKNVREGDDAEKRSLIEDKQHAEDWKCVENLLDEYTPKDLSSAKSWTGDKFMFAVVGQPVLYKACIDKLDEQVESMNVDAIVGIDANDSRADLFAMPIAEHLGKSYIPIVAADKLRTAENVVQTTYRSRFHKKTIIELVKVPHLPDIKKVVLIDSYWVTGKSTEAAIELIGKAFPAAVVECIVVVAPKKDMKRKFAGKVWPMLTNENLLKALDTEGEPLLCDDASMD